MINSNTSKQRTITNTTSISNNNTIICNNNNSSLYLINNLPPEVRLAASIRLQRATINWPAPPLTISSKRRAPFNMIHLYNLNNQPIRLTKASYSNSTRLQTR